PGRVVDATTRDRDLGEVEQAVRGLKRAQFVDGLGGSAPSTGSNQALAGKAGLLGSVIQDHWPVAAVLIDLEVISERLVEDRHGRTDGRAGGWASQRVRLRERRDGPRD